jgi:uncharacterized protein with LGFP repeats
VRQVRSVPCLNEGCFLWRLPCRVGTDTGRQVARTWAQLGGSAGFVGVPTGAAVQVAGESVTFQQFAGARLSTSAAGTFEVHGQIYTQYTKLGGP